MLSIGFLKPVSWIRWIKELFGRFVILQFCEYKPSLINPETWWVPHLTVSLLSRLWSREDWSRCRVSSIMIQRNLYGCICNYMNRIYKSAYLSFHSTSLPFPKPHTFKLISSLSWEQERGLNFPTFNCFCLILLGHIKSSAPVPRVVSSQGYKTINWGQRNTLQSF